MLESPFLRWMETLYGFLVKTGSNLQSLMLLYMRVTWGHQLFLTGFHKLKDIGGTVQIFSDIGIHAPKFHAYEVGILEVVGGIFLILGFASRLISIPLIILFITALATAHAEALSNYRFVTEPLTLVLQQPYPFLMTAFMVFFFGPGKVSLDGLIKHWVSEQPRY